MRVLDLFSGIGGMSLGLERAGFRTAAFCEISPYCRRVLARHWPDVPCYEDIRALSAGRLAADGIAADVVCGGFPCQDISLAGPGGGLAGKRSGLWFEMLRIIGEIRPRYVIAENVPPLRHRGLDTVLGGLAALGYAAEWHCIPAAAVGAPHRRDRVWIIAYAGGEFLRVQQGGRGGACRAGAAEPGTHGPAWNVADANGKPRLEGRADHAPEIARGRNADRGGFGPSLRHANGAGLALRQGVGSDPRPKLTTVERTDWWVTESDVGRVADGVPGRVDRLAALGNAVVPQIPEAIGRAILAAEAAA